MVDRQVAVAALREQLASGVGNPLGILGPEAARAAEAVRAAVPDLDADLEVAHILGWYHWARYQVLPDGQDQEDLAAAVECLRPVYPAYPEAVPDLVRRFFDSWVAGGPATGKDHALLAGRAVDLFIGYQHSGRTELLTQSIAVFRDAVVATPANHPVRAKRLSDLGSALLALFKQTGDLPTLAEAARAKRGAVAATPADHPKHAAYSNDLGVALQTLFGRTGDLPILAEAVQVGRDAATAVIADQQNCATYLSNLGSALQLQFERTGELAALVEAVQVGRDAVAAVPADHPDRFMYLNNLAIALQLLFDRTGEFAVLDEAVRFGRDAVAAVPADHPDRAACLNSLGGALQSLFGRTGEIAVLVEAVHVGRDVLAADPVDHPARAKHLNNLGMALRKMFERTGQQAALVEAVQAGRDAVAVTPADNPDRARHLYNLGTAQWMLFERTGELATLVEAVQAGRDAVAATPVDHPSRASRLSDLGGALRLLFGRTGELEVLVEAVQVGRDAVAATPIGDPGRVAYLSNLGTSLQLLFVRTGELEVLVEAVQVGAVAAAPADDPGRVAYLNNLGGALQLLFGRTGEIAVLVEAVQAGRDAVAATPEDHPTRATYLCNLGSALQSLFAQTRELAVLAEALECCQEAGSDTTGATLARIRAYRQFAMLAVEAKRNEDGLRCIEAAIDLIDTVAPGSLTRADRVHQLGLLTSLASEAAAAALHAGQPQRAVELLERTRGLLAADALGLRGRDQARLREEGHDDLADRLEQLRTSLDALDQPSSAPPADVGANYSAPRIVEEHRSLAEGRRAAHAEWDSLLEQIRALPGFTDFLRTPAIDTLARYARGGPIVFVTASRARADALVLTDTPNPVHLIPLPDLSEQSAIDHANRLRDAYQAAGARDLEPIARQDAQRKISTVLAWLWDAIAAPVLAHLGCSATPADPDLSPRIWWCPVGVLSYLPLHAAGHHTEPPDPTTGPRTVPDRIISSYTPTARALAQHRPTSATAAATLIVPVPDLPGAGLPGVATETDTISTLIPAAHILRQPTRATVLEALPGHQVAHFACHGHADWQQPANSQLLLADHATNPLTLAHVTALRLNAELAYLSACSTTITAPRLADESLHITGAFLLAGYRHVIGTLWPIDDTAAADIATGFYQHLTANGTRTLQPERAARALHHATTLLRNRHANTPSLWAAHIHTGP